MSIQHAANVSPATRPGQQVAQRSMPAALPRVLQSARAPAQLSFTFQRG